MTLSLTQIVIYAMIAAVSAYVAGMVIKARYPFGFPGAFIAALIGEWLMIYVLHIGLAPEIAYGGVQIVTAFGGALILAILWIFIASNGRRRRWV